MLGLLAFGLIATNVVAQIYRWVDDKGTVHFTDERPRRQAGVKQVVEGGAQRTPMVRGGPEWRVDTPTPDYYGSARPWEDRDYYEYDDDPRDSPPLQGDTIIQVYEPPPAWFETYEPPRDQDRKHGKDGRRHGDRDRRRDRETRPPLALPPPRADQPPPLAPSRSRASSRAVPLRR